MSDDELPPLHDIPEGVKPASAMMLMVQVTRGGVVFSAEAAIKIAELLCEVHHGTREVELQKPFVAADKGSYWRVEGSRNRPKKVDGSGPFFLSIDKHDARVTDFGRWHDLTPHPSVVPLLRAAMEGKKPDEPK
jgi:hypothetical protein